MHENSGLAEGCAWAFVGQLLLQRDLGRLLVPPVVVETDADASIFHKKAQSWLGGYVCGAVGLPLPTLSPTVPNRRF